MKKLFTFFILSMCTLFISMNANAQITVSGTAGGTLDGSYLTLTDPLGVFAALNGGGSQAGQVITVLITADLLAETGLNALNAGDWTSITVNPSGPRIVSGVVAGPFVMIDLNGADNVTIDGLNTGGNSLTISNLSVSALAETSTIRFINGATNNTVTNCIVQGSSLTLLGTSGGTIVFSTDALTPDGNDNNTISNCDIGPATATLPFKAILGLGTSTSAAIRNSGNVINNNNIFDFFGTGGGSTAGVNVLSGNDSWTISNNRLYQTGARVFTAALLRYSGIVLATTTLPGSFTVSGNRIGFANSAGTGTTSISGLSNEFRGIDAASVNTTTVTSITLNTISGISQTTSAAPVSIDLSGFIAISMGTIDGLINATLNNIGSLDGSTTIILNYSAITAAVQTMGIFNFSFRNTTISGNNIGSITINGPGTTIGFRAIYVNTATGVSATVTENTIANITNNQVGNYSMNGIRIAAPNAIVVSNVIRDMTGNANGTGVVVLNGITATGSTGVNNIEKNKIFNLKNTSIGTGSGAIYGIDVTFPATANEVKQNYVYGLSAVSSVTTYQIFGFIRRALGNATVYNNMISLGLNTDGSSITTPFSFIGIRDVASTSGSWNYYYNSVFIGGSGVASPGSNSYAMLSDVVTRSRSFINNIFWNARSNIVAGGTAHIAVRYGGVGVNPAGLTSNYNDLHASGIDGILGFYNAVLYTTLAAWQAATGQDANSSSVPVNFVSPATGNLHLDGTSVGDLELLGTPITGITTDIDKNPRDPAFPYKGAHEGPVALPVEMSSFTSSIDQRDVTLNWTTASETNNAGFDIERSQANDSWTKIGNVAGNGTTTTTKNYSFTDRNLSTGKYSYRLKQIDFNGNFNYFNLNNEVNIGVPVKFDLSQNYPNPFNPSTTINYDLPFDSKVSIELYDISGKEVARLVNEVKTAGYYTINFNASNLSSGTYFYRINADGNGNSFVDTKKMMVIK